VGKQVGLERGLFTLACEVGRGKSLLGDLVVARERASQGLGLQVVRLDRAFAIPLISSSFEPFSELIALLSASI
jgi:hypothetical protein